MKGINTKIILEQFVVRASGSMAPVNRLEFRHLARRLTIFIYIISLEDSVMKFIHPCLSARKKNYSILNKNEL